MSIIPNFTSSKIADRIEILRFEKGLTNYFIAPGVKDDETN